MDNEFLNRAQVEARAEKQRAEEKKKTERKKRIESRKPSAFVQILNGDFLTRAFVLGNLGFIFFVMFLLLMLVTKGYYGRQLTDSIAKTQAELDEVTSDYFEAKARLEEETSRTKLVEDLESSGLKETVNPTKVIRIKQKDNQGK